MKTAGGDILDRPPTDDGVRLAGDDGAGNIGDFDTWRRELGADARGILEPAVSPRSYEMGKDGMPARTGKLALVPFNLGAVVAQYGRVMARPEMPGFGSGGIVAA